MESFKIGKGLSSEGVQILSAVPAEYLKPHGELKKSNPSICCNASIQQSTAASLEKRYALPGYHLAHFVKDFLETDVGAIPLIATQLHWKDRRDTIIVRTGITRKNYRVSPGLYGVGKPHRDSEVLVTANFKLTFDILRQALSGVHAWILVLDTHGINVWCAAGKGTFGTRELIERIQATQLDKLLNHRRLIVPQLGATGIRAADVKNETGFRVIYGPIRAQDIPEFLDDRRRATPEMRQVTFGFRERLILTPIELNGALKPTLIATLFLFLCSGIGPDFFSWQGAWERGMSAFYFLLTGIITGAVLTPALLPFVPFRQFAAKGMLLGAVLSIYLMWGGRALGILFSGTEMTALFLFTAVVASFLAMNFTGATPFTSPSGVEKEMKMFIPVQVGGMLISAVLWIASAFFWRFGNI